MAVNVAVGDHKTRMKLLDFSITHCPTEEVLPLLESKQVLQLEVRICTLAATISLHHGNKPQYEFAIRGQIDWSTLQ